MQKGNQKTWTDNAKGNPFCIVYPPSSDYLFALSVHRLLITLLHCLSTAFWLWTDNAKRQSEGGGQTMQKGNQKAVVRQCKNVIRRRWIDTFCIVCPPSSDYLFALSSHSLLIIFLHSLFTAFWLPFCIVYSPPSYYLFALFRRR
jgi:hypothetical protein